MKHLIAAFMLAFAGLAFSQTDAQVDAARTAAALARIDHAQQQAIKDRAARDDAPPARAESPSWSTIILLFALAGVGAWALIKGKK